MADFEDDQDFNSAQVNQIVQNVIKGIINPDTVYQREKVNQWT